MRAVLFRQVSGRKRSNCSVSSLTIRSRSRRRLRNLSGICAVHIPAELIFQHRMSSMSPERRQQKKE
jgi:hypothetical protein